MTSLRKLPIFRMLYLQVHTFHSSFKNSIDDMSGRCQVRGSGRSEFTPFRLLVGIPESFHTSRHLSWCRRKSRKCEWSRVIAYSPHSFSSLGCLKAFFAKAPPSSNSPSPSISLSEDIFSHSFNSTGLYERLSGCRTSGWFQRLENSRESSLGMDGTSTYS